MARYDHDDAAEVHIRSAAEGLLDRVTELIAEDARRYAPVRTGKLRESIHAEPAVDGVGKVVAETDYAVYVELGTRHMAAQPYLRPALYQRRDI